MEEDLESELGELHQVGDGGSSVVYRAKHANTNSIVALKQIQLDPNYPKDYEALRMEIDVHKKLDYPFIAQFFAASCSEKKASIVMEYCGDNTLFSYIKDIGALTEAQAKKIFIQIISALQYLHSKRKIHNDIKLENVMLDSNLNAILIDFGLCSDFGSVNPGFGGTKYYTAPEVFKKQRDNTGASDIWSAGIILFVLLYGTFPFKVDDDESQQSVPSNKTRSIVFNTEFNVSIEAKDLITQLLNEDPNDRITIQEIAASPWIAGSQYANLLNPDYTNQPELRIMPTTAKEIDKNILDEVVKQCGLTKEEITKHLLEYGETRDVMIYKIKRMQSLKKQIQQFRQAQYRPPREIPLTFLAPFPIPKLTETRRYERIPKM